MDEIFNDPIKHNRLPQTRQGEKIDFEKFYNLWNCYEGIVNK